MINKVLYIRLTSNIEDTSSMIKILNPNMWNPYCERRFPVHEFWDKSEFLEKIFNN